MPRNVGNLDKTLRLILGIALAVVAAAGMVEGTWQIVLGVIAVINIGTALAGYCPLYSVIGLNTCSRKT